MTGIIYTRHLFISVDSDRADAGSSLYRGRKLDLEWLLKTHPYLKKMVQADKNRNRTNVCCTICQEYKDEASRVAKNGTVPIASGVRADGVKSLERIIDHIDSNVHAPLP